ncbi:nitrogenase component 1 [Methanomassiliicoccus luminyensis]|uniref:nitrogenase component 1 n=1 Tax=Methanomassiliicoccus luminyensis TaxID=1080712 RepID=UPI0009DA2DF6|nr:nitrogenase component 1 [Methanomassiliicoccus luminyensis]
MYCEPFKSCYLFGSLRIVSNFKNCVYLINGPSGCAFFCRNSVLLLNGYTHMPYSVNLPRIFTTNLTDKDVVFGSTDRLEEDVLEIDVKYNPDAIFIFNCCVSEIIGMYIEDLEKKLEKITKAKIIAVPSAGFKGDHKIGMKVANKKIFEKVVKRPTMKVPYSVNILGDADRFGHTTKELRSFLDENNISIITSIPGDVDMKSVSESSEASLNIIVCGTAGYGMAKLYLEEYGVPFVGGQSSVFGINHTFELYKAILDHFGKSLDDLEQRRQTAFDNIRRFRTELSDKKAFIIAGARRSFGYAALLKELGMSVEYIFTESNDCVLREEDALRMISKQIIYDEWDEELRNRIRMKRPDLVLSTLPELIIPEKYVSRTLDDFAGFSGAERFAQYIYDTIILQKMEEVVFIRAKDDNL